jgi:hypothetical protein
MESEDLTERVAEVVRSYFPYARCLTCVADDLNVKEPDVRSAAQMLIVADRFRLVRRICYGCSRSADTLMPHADLAESD